jgi:hypothetical protein
MSVHRVTSRRVFLRGSGCRGRTRCIALISTISEVYRRLYRCDVACRCSKALFASMLVRVWTALRASPILMAWAHFRG